MIFVATLQFKLFYLFSQKFYSENIKSELWDISLEFKEEKSKLSDIHLLLREKKSIKSSKNFFVFYSLAKKRNFQNYYRLNKLKLVWGRNIFGGSSGIEELEHASQGYFVEGGVLMRKWRPPTATADDDWKVV